MQQWVMQGLRETAATSVGPAHLPRATAVRHDPTEALQQAVSTRLRPGFHRRYVPPPTPSSPIPPRVRRLPASSGEDPRAHHLPLLRCCRLAGPALAACSLAPDAS
jgi:hypothetical protein